MKVIFWILLVGFSFFLWVRYIERHNIYFPMKEITATPQLVEVPYEEVYFETPDGKTLSGWFIPKKDARFTVLFCHGNGGNISHRLEKLAFFYGMGVNTFIFDYRGYGKSSGVPSEKGLYTDAVTAYQYLTDVRGSKSENIIVYGESLGGAVAIDLAVKKKLRALVTEEAFTSVSDMARIVYPFVPDFFVFSKFDSVSKIGNVTCPKLIIHSLDDEIVPFSLGEKLYKTAKEPKRLVKLRGAHNTAFFDSRDVLFDELKGFVYNEKIDK